MSGGRSGACDPLNNGRSARAAAISGCVVALERGPDDRGELADVASGPVGDAGQRGLVEDARLAVHLRKGSGCARRRRASRPSSRKLRAPSHVPVVERDAHAPDRPADRLRVGARPHVKAQREGARHHDRAHRAGWRGRTRSSVGAVGHAEQVELAGCRDGLRTASKSSAVAADVYARACRPSAPPQRADRGTNSCGSRAAPEARSGSGATVRCRAGRSAAGRGRRADRASNPIHVGASAITSMPGPPGLKTTVPRGVGGPGRVPDST